MQVEQVDRWDVARQSCHAHATATVTHDAVVCVRGGALHHLSQEPEAGREAGSHDNRAQACVTVIDHLGCGNRLTL